MSFGIPMIGQPLFRLCERTSMNSATRVFAPVSLDVDMDLDLLEMTDANWQVPSNYCKPNIQTRGNFRRTSKDQSTTGSLASGTSLKNVIFMCVALETSTWLQPHFAALYRLHGAAL